MSFGSPTLLPMNRPYTDRGDFDEPPASTGFKVVLGLVLAGCGALLVLGLCGCVSSGGQPQQQAPPPSWAFAPQMVNDFSGEFTTYGRLGNNDAAKITATFNATGTGRAILAPVAPYIIFVGDGSVIVEPATGETDRANDDISSGRVVLRGVTAAPNGTIRSMQDSTVQDFPPAEETAP